MCPPLPRRYAPPPHLPSHRLPTKTQPLPRPPPPSATTPLVGWQHLTHWRSVVPTPVRPTPSAHRTQGSGRPGCPYAPSDTQTHIHTPGIRPLPLNIKTIKISKNIRFRRENKFGGKTNSLKIVEVGSPTTVLTTTKTSSQLQTSKQNPLSSEATFICPKLGWFYGRKKRCGWDPENDGVRWRGWGPTGGGWAHGTVRPPHAVHRYTFRDMQPAARKGQWKGGWR